MSSFIQVLGGIGLFLLGMTLMTSGLEKLAGRRLRSWLERSTRTPLSGAITGATVTALVQSSSATTVAAIGFVGAGLMTFNASLGIIFGANIGTTVTGWMVAVLGFELELSEAALPLLFVAAICYLFKSVRLLRGAGKALAGFCLIFLGISYMQLGLGGFEDSIDLSAWAIDSLGGRFLLVLIGVGMTLLTQSSSATVATSITALNAGILDVSQAAAVVIGADVGTTGTAALATIGGSTASRRTGFAHVTYNLLNGTVAFFLMPLYLWIVDLVLPNAVAGSPEIVVVSFHSIFNVVGVMTVLPFTDPFRRVIEWLFPERESSLLAPFDARLLTEHRAALSALEHGCFALAEALLQQTAKALGASTSLDSDALVEIRRAIDSGRDFAMKVGEVGEDEGDIESSRIFACVHLLDHFERLLEHVTDERSSRVVTETPTLKREADDVKSCIEQLERVIRMQDERGDEEADLQQVAQRMEDDKSRIRQVTIERATRGELSGDEIDARLGAQRWLRRVTYHSARIAHYITELRSAA